MTEALSVTVFAKSGGPLTKRISLDENGLLKSDGSACVMSRGTARRFEFSALEPLASLIGRLSSHEALALGALRPDLPDHVEVVTKQKLNGVLRPDIIARTTDYLTYEAGRPALALVDYDTKGMPQRAQARIAEVGGPWPALLSACPALDPVARVERRSTSAGLYRIDTGAQLPGSGGWHVFILVKDGADSERFLKTLHLRCWLAGLGWMMVGRAGQLLDRSIVDCVVGAPERLVFEGPPILVPPLQQEAAGRKPVVIQGEAFDSLHGCPPLTIVETAKLKELQAREVARLQPEANRIRKAFIAEQAERLAKRTGMTTHAAAEIVERQCARILLPDVILPFDDEELAGSTVADVLADPARFEDATLADPLEGVEYGRGKAKIMIRGDGTLWIHSFAHGRTAYELKYDYRAAEAALNAATKDEGVSIFQYYALIGDFSPDHLVRLRDLASKISGVGKRILDAQLKEARKEQAERRRREQGNERRAARHDPRPMIPAPAPDAPWLEQMGVLNEVLGASREPEPPMRDIDGWVHQVRLRQTPNMHAFTLLGANAEELEETRLPPPEQPLFTRLSEAQLAELIERYLDYFDEEKRRSVHLNSGFVKHFQIRHDDKLPLAVAIAALPIVMGDGTLLAGRGLDRERGIVFRVPPELTELLPARAECTAARVAEAMHFLCDDWLCDVATDYAGKCVLISLALTIIERSLLPDRPAFWITAGKRASGKTTTITMLLVAVLGFRPAAAAWSPNEEERRKALFAYLLEGLASILWDNIRRGSQISCPHIEKACTSAVYSDRKLGVSESISASAATIQIFTGNNVAPKGDLASRSLASRLDVDRHDPENRDFRHPDPIGWTEAHRGRILQALYTILLGNPLFHGMPDIPQTRFKVWWNLVGQAVEFAAQQHEEHARAAGWDLHESCPPSSVSFKQLFLKQEDDDEESATLADVLAILAGEWSPEKNQSFTAAQVAEIMNSHIDIPANKDITWQDNKERALTLRTFLLPVMPTDKLVSAMIIGRALLKHRDNPVSVGMYTLSLRGTHESHANSWVFHVTRKRDAGG